MASEPQLLFDLFDSYWFTHQIFNISQTPPSKNEEPATIQTTQNPNFPSLPTINSKSHSDQLFINSVKNLRIPKEVNEVEEKGVAAVPVVKNKSLRKKMKSKSLSELEFEEVKGFMDLGFLFSEKDKDTRLVSIIPGLQRLGEDDEEHASKSVDVSRPYLSEAWGDRKEEKLRVIRVPVIGSEANVKNQLRFWAHSVASVVR